MEDYYNVKFGVDVAEFRPEKDSVIVVKVNIHLFDLQTAKAFFDVIQECFPNHTVILLPNGMELMQKTRDELIAELSPEGFHAKPIEELYGGH